jgi:hypothetical protein
VAAGGCGVVADHADVGAAGAREHGHVQPALEQWQALVPRRCSGHRVLEAAADLRGHQEPTQHEIQKTLQGSPMHAGANGNQLANNGLPSSSSIIGKLFKYFIKLHSAPDHGRCVAKLVNPSLARFSMLASMLSRISGEGIHPWLSFAQGGNTKDPASISPPSISRK